MHDNVLAVVTACMRTFEYGCPPLHVVLVPADPSKLGRALASGQVIQGAGLHTDSQTCPQGLP